MSTKATKTTPEDETKPAPKPAAKSKAKRKPKAKAAKRGQAPPKLNAAGKYALERALAAVDEPERYYDGCVVYAEAVDRHAQVVRFWRSEGCPIIALGGATGRVEQAHPLLNAMNEADKAVRSAAQALGLDPVSRTKLGSRGGGRPAGSALPAHIPDRPSSRLRLVS